MSTRIKMSMDRHVTRSLIDGVSPKVMGVSAGRKVMIKCSENCPTESLAELFAYRLGEELGLRVNEVDITTDGKLFGLSRVCSVHVWEEELITSGRYQNHQSEEDRQILAFFDAILDNDDRNHGNFGYINDKLFLLDHGFASPWDSVGPYETVKLEAKYDSIPEIVEKFLSLTEEDFWEMTELPDELKIEFHEKYIDGIVLRMIEAQLIIKRELIKC